MKRPSTGLVTLNRLIGLDSIESASGVISASEPEVFASERFRPAGCEAVWFSGPVPTEYRRWIEADDATAPHDPDGLEPLRGGVLVIEVDGRFYAISFGEGFRRIQDDARDQRFGLRVALRALAGTELGEVIGDGPGPGRIESTPLADGGSVLWIRPGNLSEIVRRIGGHALPLTGQAEGDRPARLYNASGLRLRLGRQAADLVADLRTITAVHDRPAPRPELAFVDDIAPVGDPQTRHQLDADVESRFTATDFGRRDLAVEDDRSDGNVPDDQNQDDQQDGRVQLALMVPDAALPYLDRAVSYRIQIGAATDITGPIPIVSATATPPAAASAASTSPASTSPASTSPASADPASTSSDPRSATSTSTSTSASAESSSTGPRPVETSSAGVALPRIALPDLIGPTRLQPAGSRLSALRAGHVSICDLPGGRRTLTRTSAVKWIEATVHLGDRRFALLEGVWHEFDPGFTDRVHHDVAALLGSSAPLVLPGWPSNWNEQTYSRHVHRVAPEHLYLPGQELCDLLGPADELIQVTRAQGSADLSHRFARSLASVPEPGDPAPTRGLRRLVEELGRGRQLPSDFRPSRVVFALRLDHGRRLTPDTLFPFAQAALAQTAAALRKRRIRLDVVGVEGTEAAESDESAGAQTNSTEDAA